MTCDSVLFRPLGIHKLSMKAKIMATGLGSCGVGPMLCLCGCCKDAQLRFPVYIDIRLCTCSFVTVVGVFRVAVLFSFALVE